MAEWVSCMKLPLTDQSNGMCTVYAQSNKRNQT